jgi:hypothetical protein
LNEQDIEKLFPNLINSAYSITSPASVEYNCIAWASGDTERYWWPDSNNIGYWPDDVPREETLKAFIAVYEILGYTVCLNAGYEEGFEKAAIYVDSNGKPTHAARQLNSGRWTSKLGKLEDIEHNTLNNLSGSQYGTVAIIMKRHKYNE